MSFWMNGCLDGSNQNHGKHGQHCLLAPQLFVHVEFLLLARDVPDTHAHKWVCSNFGFCHLLQSLETKVTLVSPHLALLLATSHRWGPQWDCHGWFSTTAQQRAGRWEWFGGWFSHSLSVWWYLPGALNQVPSLIANPNGSYGHSRPCQ